MRLEWTRAASPTQRPGHLPESWPRPKRSTARATAAAGQVAAVGVGDDYGGVTGVLVGAAVGWRSGVGVGGLRSDVSSIVGIG